VSGSDPATGRLSARADVLTALVAAGLAVPHGRGGHHSFYLTAEGRGLRAELAGAGTATPEPPPSPPVAAASSFTADDGTGAAAPADTAARAAEVATAWEGLVQIRAVLGDAASVPAPWERDRVVHAVALALEAAGCPPARPGSPGYRVRASAHAGLAEVGWSDPASAAAALERCSRLLPYRGWHTTVHRTASGSPYLLASPAHRR
jgi:hypothetical protein